MNVSLKKIINIELTRIFIVQVFLGLLEVINGLVDMMFGGQYLGTDQMSAVGLFNPVTVFISAVCYLFATGAGIRGSALYGKGDLKNTNRVFTSCTVILASAGVIVSLVLWLGNDAVVSFLSKGANAGYLKAYTYGMLPGIIFQFLPAALAPFLQIMGKGKAVSVSCIAMVTCNAVLDWALIVSGYGIWGMGIATSVSYMVQAAIMLVTLLAGRSYIHFSRSMYSVKEYLPLMKLGLANFLCMFVISAKSTCVNHIIINNFDEMYVSVLSVINSILGLFGAFIFGTSNAVQIVGNVYYGDANEDGIRGVLRAGMIKILFWTSMVIAVIVIFAEQLSLLFFDAGSIESGALVNALRLIPWYLPAMAVVAIMKVYLLMRGRAVETAVISVAEQLSVLAFNYILSAAWGINGIWLSCTFGHTMVLVVILLLKLAKREKMFDTENCFKDKNIRKKVFGIRNAEDAVRTSEESRKFCLESGTDKRTAMYTAMCIEEFAGNILKNGGKNIKYGILVNVVKSDEDLRISIKDGCIPFDPEKWLALHNSEDVTRHIGIRMVSRISDKMVYRQNIGMNVVTIILNGSGSADI